MRVVMRHTRYMLIPLGLMTLLGIMAMRPTPDDLERVLERGELVVATRVAPTTFYEDHLGATGMDFQLVKGLADKLGVNLRLETADTLEELFALLDSGRADIAAAGLTITPDRQLDYRFSSPYQEISEQLIYRYGEGRPRSIEDLAGRSVVVLADSSHETRMREITARVPDIQLEVITAASDERLLSLVEQGHFDYTLVDSNAWTIHRPLFPDLALGFDLGEQRLGIAFRRDGDRRLYIATQRYLTQMRADGSLARLENRFYGHKDHFNLYAARSFTRHLDTRLPQYLDAFRAAAEEHGFDWRLLAALGYQESMWDSSAVSPTGVRGLMMLTLPTAREMGVADRTDPFESIAAGAAYLRRLYDRIPERIEEPDRMWRAVAAYNVGMGHLEDARILTQRQGGNPDSWEDVRQRLPLLKQAEYYRTTRYGYARSGAQAVIYVRHIKRYYDTLVWAAHSEKHGQMLLAMN